MLKKNKNKTKINIDGRGKRLKKNKIQVVSFHHFQAQFSEDKEKLFLLKNQNLMKVEHSKFSSQLGNIILEGRGWRGVDFSTCVLVEKQLSSNLKKTRYRVLPNIASFQAQ